MAEDRRVIAALTVWLVRDLRDLGFHQRELAGIAVK
jgi:hypothetical protein